MISTSILYCNKLDALPLASDYKTSDSTCSNSLTNSVNTSGGRFRVRYLGSNACDVKTHRLNDGISAFQKSLLDLYTTTRRRSIALRSFYPFSLNQVIDVCSYGVVVAERDPTVIKLNRSEVETVVTKVITPLSNILLWAAVRFNSRVSGKRRVFGAAFVPLSCSDAVLNKKSFIPLSSKQRFLVGLPHPPLFVCVLQKVSNPRELECHLFVCALAEDAISLCALLGDTQKHYSKVGALELPLPGQMGNYSFKSPSRMSRSTTDGHIRSVTIDTQSDSSRVGGKSVSISSYKSRFTPTTQMKSKYKFRPQQQVPQQYKSHQQIQKQPFKRKTQIESIHTKNSPQISVENNSKASLQSRDYRFQSYRLSDNTQTPTATPTTSSSSERHHYHNHCNQRYQSRNNSKNGFLVKRDMRKVYCNCINDNNISIINDNRGIKHTQKNAKRYASNYNNSDIIGKNVRDDREVTSVQCKCGTSSDSGEPKLGTKGNITIKSGNIMCHKGSTNYKYNNGHNPFRKEIMNTRVITENSNARNYVTSDESNYCVKNDVKTRESQRNSVHRKHRSQDINGDSSVESSSISEIIVNDNVKRVLDNKQLLYRDKVNTNKVSVNVPNVIKSTQSPQRRYFGDTLRVAKSFEVLNNSSDSSTSCDDKKSQPKHFVQVRNATTSCRDAPWIVNKDKQSMTVSKTIFLGSESDSKKSSSMSQISNDSITKRNHTRSSPNLICSKDEFDSTHASGGVELTREAQLHSNYKLINVNTRSQSSRSGSPFARNNRVAIYLPEMKCVKSFNSRSDVKQWSTLSLSSNIETNISSDKSAPNSRPDLSYKTTLPVVEHETLATNVPRITRFNSPDFTNRNRSSIISRLRRMSLRSWVNARRGTTRFLSRFNSKRRRRKRYSNPSTDSAIDVETNDFRPEKQIYLVNQQNSDNARRKHSWSFHDFTLKYPTKENKNKNLKHFLTSGTSSPSLNQQNIANNRVVDNKFCAENYLLCNNPYITTTQIPVSKGPKAILVNESNNSNGDPRPQNSMSSDSGMEEVDCLSSTDVTNSINSRRKPVTVCHNKRIGNDFKNGWQLSAQQHINHIANKRKPFRHWSQTNLEEELGYMP